MFRVRRLKPLPLRLRILVEEIAAFYESPPMRSTDKPHRTGVFGDIADSDPGAEHLSLPVGEVLLILMPADIARRLSVRWFVEQLRRKELHRRGPHPYEG